MHDMVFELIYAESGIGLSCFNMLIFLLFYMQRSSCLSEKFVLVYSHIATSDAINIGEQISTEKFAAFLSMYINLLFTFIIHGLHHHGR